MQKHALLIVFMFCATCLADAIWDNDVCVVTASHLTTEYSAGVVVVDNPHPRLGWWLTYTATPGDRIRYNNTATHPFTMNAK